ncbi:MAG: hypothetical protein CSA55_03115 [Ilumatobacter coccineus]|uniref:Uncharacterized protein n=1 Tax=Ilumatobacter coccineus TaxID=467094 RepID=A0A2G6KCY6_9ACTN|nr:MAG: hypothetical protein CSA55_03115 [Ilumatobacter coccineus]
MSQRHRTSDSPTPPKQELRAQAHSERHRVQVELNKAAQLVSAGLEPDDVHEPANRWRPPQRRDAAVAKAKLAKQKRRNRRHWKTKMWKRRTTVRRQKFSDWDEERRSR